MFGRKLTALFLVMALFAALAPMSGAMAGPASPMAVQAQKTISMLCDRHMPRQGNQMPCNDSCGCCLGMAGCVAPVTPPELAALPGEFRFAAMVWNPERDPGDRSTHPPYRPPIS